MLLWLTCLFTSEASGLTMSFIGNSLMGGKAVGGSQGEGCAEAWPQIPTGESPNPGDVPSKVKMIANAAKARDFKWQQNTRSSYSLHAHASECLLVNQALMNSDIVFIQPLSNELQSDACQPSKSQVSSLNRLIQKAPAHTRVLLLETWAYYNHSENGVKSEICFFEQVKCTTLQLSKRATRHVEVVPVGSAFRALAERACTIKTNANARCAQQTLAFGGYDTTSCDPLVWGDVSGVFVDSKHQSEASGAWLEALVMYAYLSSPPCLPPASLLRDLQVPLYAELTSATRAALQAQDQLALLPECNVP